MNRIHSNVHWIMILFCPRPRPRHYLSHGMNTGQILLFKIYVFYGYCFQYSIYHSIYQQYRVCVSVFVRLNPFETVAKLQMNINTCRLIIECGRERKCVCDLNTKCWVFLFKQWMIHYHHCILLLCVKHKIICCDA